VPTGQTHRQRPLRLPDTRLAFGSPRTAHRLAAGLENAGLALRDALLTGRTHCAGYDPFSAAAAASPAAIGMARRRHRPARAL
jgi:hypothetical protein